ncbi:MAG: Hsp33 family molecular chaperone HslO [Firmicutes bacterium]|nr:Hsp33 family molecular chaperone HslO [Bacillota bacterium]MDD4693422.1 Hsp33 family molecular chaperone HslO [Bacillota bacterium]
MDHLVTGIADAKFRIVAITGKDTVEVARQRHNLSHTATAAVGRVLLGAGLLASSFKSKQERILLQFRGDGPISPILAVADRNVSVKGYCEYPHVELDLSSQGKLDVGKAVGKGMLYVVRERDNYEPYTGSVPIQTGEIGDDLAYYLQISEQVPSAVGLGVLVDGSGFVRSAAGILVQVFPGVSEEDIVKLEEKLMNLGSISHRFDTGETPESLLNDLFPHWNKLEERPLTFDCDCSKDRFSRGLISLGKDELTDLIKKHEPVETVCRFCNEKYLFSIKEIEELLKKA